MIKKSNYDQKLLDLYDGYAHGLISRREFLDRAVVFTTGGLTAAGLLSSLSPNYVLAQQVLPNDKKIVAEYKEYSSPRGAGAMRGYLVRPTEVGGKLPGILVVHENRGLNPYIEDVTRRAAVAGFIAFAPDALTPLGGYPGSDDKGRELQRQRDSAEMVEDFIAGVEFLKSHEQCTGRVGVVGFCFGGGMANKLAVRIPDLGAAVAFYGRQPAGEDVPKIQAPVMIHNAELDKRINAGWPAYEAALIAGKKKYVAHMYEGVNHGFHNDTTPRFDKPMADLAWKRTIEFFRETL